MLRVQERSVCYQIRPRGSNDYFCGLSDTVKMISTPQGKALIFYSVHINILSFIYYFRNRPREPHCWEPHILGAVSGAQDVAEYRSGCSQDMDVLSHPGWVFQGTANASLYFSSLN